MNEHTFLFIGGTKDGQRLTVEPLPTIEFPLPPNETETYRKQLLWIQKSVFTFYVADSITDEEVVEMVFSAYQTFQG